MTSVRGLAYGRRLGNTGVVRAVDLLRQDVARVVYQMHNETSMTQETVAKRNTNMVRRRVAWTNKLDALTQALSEVR